MRTAIRWFVVVVTIVHGLIHLLGVAKGFGWAEVAELEGPISTAGGIAWLVACVLLVSTGVLLAARWRWWWVVGAISAVVSQVVIVTAWSDAWAGTVANAILLAAVVYGFAVHGPTGVRAEYRRICPDDGFNSSFEGIKQNQAYKNEYCYIKWYSPLLEYECL